jgi:glyoxylase-like metal-dependent hydrolase (beta-lactamase superfamily II)
MAHSLTIGRIRCHLLSDGITLADGGGFFGLIPRVMWERVIRPNERNQIPGDARSLLIESDAGLVLVDTGFGDKFGEKMRNILGLDDSTDRLVADLCRAGFAPEDVDWVILTHLHGDHAGGATRHVEPADLDSPIEPTFPKARYIAQRIDLADASFPNERTAATYDAANWQPLLDAGLLDVVDGPQQIGAHIRTDIASGHTAALQTVWVEDGGETLLFLGDACSWAAHMNRLAWVPSFDVMPMLSIETKRRLRAEAMRRDALLVFQHDAQVATGRLIEGERGPEVQPLVTAEIEA